MMKPTAAWLLSFSFSKFGPCSCSATTSRVEAKAEPGRQGKKDYPSYPSDPTG